MSTSGDRARLVPSSQTDVPHFENTPTPTQLEQKTMSLTKGVHHVGFTVANLARSTAFFVDALKFNKVGERDYPAVFVSDGSNLITLWQAKTENPTPFNRQTNLGLHHAAFAVESPEALQAAFDAAVAHPGVTVDFPPEALGDSGARHAMIFEPSGIRLEFIYWPSA